MRAACSETTIKGMAEVASPGNKEVGERFERLAKRFTASDENGKMLRTVLGIKHKGDVYNGLRNWILMRTKVDINDKSEPLLAGDMNKLEVELERADGIIRRIVGSGNVAEVRGNMKKWYLMPYDVFRKKIPGGHDIWMDISTMSAEKNAKIENIGVLVEDLNRQLNEIKAIGEGNAANQTRKLQDDFSVAKTRLDNLNKQIAEGVDVNRSDLARARQEMETARAKLSDAKSGRDGGKNIATQFYNDLVGALEGKYGPPEKAASILRKKYDKDARVRDYYGLISEIQGFLTHYGEQAKEANEKAKRNLVQELTRHKGVREGRAQRIAEDLYAWKQEENYYPRRQLVNNYLARKAVAAIRSAGSENEMEAVMRAFRSSHMKQRKAERGTEYDIDIPTVLKGYAEDVIFADYANSVAESVNKWSAHLRDSKFMIKRSDWHTYVDASIEEVSSWAADMVFGNEPTIGDSAVKSLMSLKAIGTMGLPNLSTPIVNLVEGMSHTVLRAGINRISKSGNMSSDARKEFEAATEGNHTKLSAAGTYYGEAPKRGSMDFLRDHFTNDEIELITGIETGTAERFASLAESVTGKAASGFLTAQRWAENKNRSVAFRVGASDELEAMKRLKKFFVRGDFPVEALEKNGIDPGMLKKNPKVFEGSSNEKAWKLYQKKRATRAGYEMIYATQWQYDMAARHMLERWRPMDVPVGKMLMMYQHYPLNWLMSYHIGIERVAAIVKHGGVKSLFSPSTRDISLGHKIPLLNKHINHDTMYQVAVGSVHITNQALRYAWPVMLGAAFQFPVYEILHDLKDYFTGDDEKKERAFFGRGVANQITGPFYSDFTDFVAPAIGQAINSYLMDTGDLPQQYLEYLRIATGIDWTQKGLKEQEEARLAMKSWSTMLDGFLTNTVGHYSKTKAFAKSLDEDFYGMMPAATRMVGFYPNYEGYQNQQRLRERLEATRQP